MFTADWFFALDKTLRDAGLDSDAQSFDEIKENLSHRHICTPDEFAAHAAYVILAGGFSQRAAKKIHAKIINAIHDHGAADFDNLMTIFANKNKINAICKIWNNRDGFTRAYYELNDTDARIEYLSRLPHIGKITANHLARNLGEDVVKYDIWIQRLGVAFSGNAALAEKINNGKLDSEIKAACDDMFATLCKCTGCPRGYVDVVLWKSCQQGLIKL